MKTIIFATLLGLFVYNGAQALPTLYEYYTENGINSGLSADQTYFTLNGKNITILSGALHYFRVPRAYWSDRLRKMRAAGLNAVETYVPWNLHEPQENVFDFGNGDNDMSDFLHLEEFLQTAQKEDLFVLLRSGPYICAEWEFGGLPSWILRNNETLVRTSESSYINYVQNYFSKLLAVVAPLQFTKNGPIIALQVENEYGNTETSNFTPDKNYLKILRETMLKSGIVELLYTSDSAGKGTIGSLPQLLQTANFARNAKNELDTLNSFQKNRPTMAMEFWTGWYDKWSEQHQTRDSAEFKEVLEAILGYPASLNMYMFHGGTSFGFTSGANLGSWDNSGYMPLTNSYDYDSPLAENGDYTEKYDIVKEVLEKLDTVKTKLPDKPALKKRVAVDTISISLQKSLKEIIDNFPEKIQSDNLTPMELLPGINNNNGQSYGYIVYSKNLTIPANAVLKITGNIYDTILVLVNGKLINPPFSNTVDLNGFGFWRQSSSEIKLTDVELKSATIDLIVENMGRNNFGALEQFKQYKGLFPNTVSISDENLMGWTIVPLEFKKSWTQSLDNWSPFNNSPGPMLYKATFEVAELTDTYVDMQEWVKGIVIVNGFVLGRHFKVGPTQAVYVPAPFLQLGTNEIVILEHFQAPNSIKFSTDMIYGNL